MKDYVESRALFADGDIVFFSAGKANLVRSVIRWFSRGKLYHVGIVFWVTVNNGQKRLILAEAQPDGYRIINLGFYRDRDMTVLRCPVPWHLIADQISGEKGVIEYSLYDLLQVGLRERFGFTIPYKKSNAVGVCSGVVSSALSAGGLLGLETMISPQRLFDHLCKTNEIIFTVTPKKP